MEQVARPNPVLKLPAHVAGQRTNHVKDDDEEEPSLTVLSKHDRPANGGTAAHLDELVVAHGKVQTSPVGAEHGAALPCDGLGST